MGLPVARPVVAPGRTGVASVNQPAPSTPTAKAGPRAPKPAAAPVQTPTQPYRTPSSYSVTGGFGMRGPSASEYAYGENAGQLKTPGATEAIDPKQAYAEGFGKSAQGQLYASQQPGLSQATGIESYASDPSGYGRAFGDSAAGQYWTGLQRQGSAVPQDMSAYYDRAREKGSAQLDRAAAARGMFGSSAALDQQRELASDIGASQAQAEADYALKSALARNDIMGGAAQAADQSGLASYMGQANVQNLAAGSSLDRVRAAQQGAQGADAAALGYGGFGLEGATSADRAKLDRLELLGKGASAADAGRIERARQYADQIGITTENALGLVGGSVDDLFDTDQGYIDQIGQLGLGSGKQLLSGAEGNQAATGARGAELVQTGANNDATARQILMSSGKK